MTDHDLSARLQGLRRAFDAHPMPGLPERRAHLARLKAALLAHRHALAEAAARDFGSRSPAETLFLDVMPAIQAIDHSRRRLAHWLAPRRRPVGWLYQPARAEVMYQPLGVVGIMVPWNYPILLALGPLVGALAAGNRAMVKLSEFVPETSAVMARMLADVFEPDQVQVVQGDARVSAEFAALPFDHLLFTGSTQVGRRVMQAAAANLTPVTLELGGKCPAIVHESYDLERAAARICFGKSLNAGQTCIAPDYVLCPQARVDALAAALARQFRRLYPQPAEGDDYCAIINAHHYQRLQTLLDDARAKGARLLPLAEDPRLAGQRRLPLTLALDTGDDMAIRQQEIFGPILPIVPYRDLDEAIAYVQARPRPLALYYFDDDRARQARVLARTHSGGVCINDTILHIAQDDLPFGGIGASGMGHYHGHEGFLTFSKAKSVLRRGRLNLLALAYPPFRRRLLGWMERWLLR